MPSSNEYENDPVDALLKGGKFDRDEQLHDAVLAQTTAVLRRRRHMRRAGVVAALTICYLAGAATMRLWRPLASDDGGLIARETEERPPEIVPEDRVATKPTEKTPDRQRQAHKLRRAGFEDIRRVSDRYLHEKGDVALALRYYTRALDTASNEQRAISVEEDSWLLMALKKSQMEEKQDDNNG